MSVIKVKLNGVPSALHLCVHILGPVFPMPLCQYSIPVSVCGDPVL